MPSGRDRERVPARISCDSAIEVDFIKLISSFCCGHANREREIPSLRLKRGQEFLIPFAKESKLPPPNGQTGECCFFEGDAVVWILDVDSKKKGQHFSTLLNSLFRTQVRTHTNFPHRRNSIFQESVFSVHLYLHRFFTESISRVRGGGEIERYISFLGIFNIPACGG